VSSFVTSLDSDRDVERENLRLTLSFLIPAEEITSPHPPSKAVAVAWTVSFEQMGAGQTAVRYASTVETTETLGVLSARGRKFIRALVAKHSEAGEAARVVVRVPMQEAERDCEKRERER